MTQYSDMQNLFELDPISLTCSWKPSGDLPDLPLPVGHYAGAKESDGALTLWRDPVGSHKLFYGRGPTGDWIVANRIHRMLSAGVACEAIRSCPAGQVVRVEGEALHILANCSPASSAEDDTLVPEMLYEIVRPRLADAFSSIAGQFPGARFVVCLSGGLDSSVIASWSKQYLSGVVSFSFSFSDDFKSGLSGSTYNPSMSEDFVSARRIADVLGLPFVPVVRPRAAVGAALREAVVLGQDWRDFNAHCAVINLFLAQSIRAAFPGEQVVVLTGDLMNEYVCDYREEIVDGTVYYEQPKVSIGRRRRFFVKGLDASDREGGVFSAFGLTLVQPFAAVADPYLQLPSCYLDTLDIKTQLNGPLLSPQLLECVNVAKTRAQVGGRDGGVLGICHREGIGQKELMTIWADSFAPEHRKDALRLIEFGAYRA